MKKTPKAKGTTVQLDAETTLVLNREREKLIAGLNEAGFNGLAMAPSLGALARAALRKSCGLPENKNDDLYAK